MRVPQSYIQKCKVAMHCFQAVFVFVAACLTIAVMTKDGEVDGATKYFFAMVRCISLESHTTLQNTGCKVEEHG
jgi:hypothetical protein